MERKRRNGKTHSARQNRRLSRPLFMTRIAPVELADPTVPSQKANQVVCATTAKPTSVLKYELRASAAQLPIINCTKSIKNVWLGRAALAHFNAFLYRHKTVLAVAHVLATLTGAGALYSPPPWGSVFAVSSGVLNFPGIVVGLFVLRYDMVKVLLRTYEFWYLSVTNAVAMVLMAIHFSDLRAFALLPTMLGSEITILIDASYRAVNTTVLASIATGLILFGFTIFAVLGLDTDVMNPPIFNYGSHAATTVDGISNCLSTVVLMLWRNALRKYLVLTNKRISTPDARTNIRCITYRCRVRLAVTECEESTNNTNSKAPSRVLVREGSKFVRNIPPMTQLKFVQPTEVFDPSCTLFPVFYKPSLVPLHRYLRWVLQVIFVVAITITSIVLAASSSFMDASLMALSSSSIVTTLLFCVLYAVHSHRRLLRLLCTSFDFAFVSTQLSVAHVCICDAFCWDVRCLAVLSSWLWVHWVLTIDVVTPVMRARLGYTRFLAQVVITIFVAAHVALSLEIIFWNRLQLKDRAIFAATFGARRVEVRTIPILFGRMFTTFCWSLRLLWRLSRRSHDELIMIQGSVMFQDSTREKETGRLASGSMTTPK